MAVTTGDVAETQALLFCGADAGCPTGDPDFPTPLALARRSGQRLQMEFLQHNLSSGKGPKTPKTALNPGFRVPMFAFGVGLTWGLVPYRKGFGVGVTWGLDVTAKGFGVGVTMGVWCPIGRGWGSGGSMGVCSPKCGVGVPIGFAAP